jgi:hypothetical protein
MIWDAASQVGMVWAMLVACAVVLLASRRPRP